MAADKTRRRLADLLRVSTLIADKSAANLRARQAEYAKLTTLAARLDGRMDSAEHGFDRFRSNGAEHSWRLFETQERRRIGILAARARLAVEAARKRHARNEARRRVLEKLCKRLADEAKPRI